MLPPTMRSCADASFFGVHPARHHAHPDRPGHMSFLLGLVADFTAPAGPGIRGHRFTIGHSVTLALAVTGILRPHAEYIDALVALTIAVIVPRTLPSRHIGLAPRLGIGLPLLAMAAASFAGHWCAAAAAVLRCGPVLRNYLMLSGHLRRRGPIAPGGNAGIRSDSRLWLRCHAASKCNCRLPNSRRSWSDSISG